MSASTRPRIIDGHAHVGSMRFIPRAFVSGVAANMLATQPATAGFRPTQQQIEHMLIAQHQDHTADELIAGMEAAGVEKTVLLVPDFTRVLDCDLSIEQMALEHHLIRQRHPGRFFVFQGVDPRAGRPALEFFERTVEEYGFEGLKLYPPCGYSPSDRRLDEFYEICAARGLPVLLHTGPTSPVLDFRFAHPDRIDRAAKRFPRVNFILAHGGVNHTDSAALLCAYRPNVFLDIAGFPGTLRAGGVERQLRELFALGINHKIIFGTDWPLFSATHSTRDCVELLVGDGGIMAALPPEQVRWIMAENIERLIPPPRARQAITIEQHEVAACN
jgi:uncharacterized protein